MPSNNRYLWVVGLTLCTAVIAGCQEQEGTVLGPRGGELTSDDGRFSIAIPAGALSSEIDITLMRVECGTPDALEPCYEVGPVGLPMLTPARVTYEIDASLLEAFPAEALAVFVEREETWSELADRDVHPRAGAVSASAVYLSSYALVAAP